MEGSTGSSGKLTRFGSFVAAHLQIAYNLQFVQTKLDSKLNEARFQIERRTNLEILYCRLVDT